MQTNAPAFGTLVPAAQSIRQATGSAGGLEIINQSSFRYRAGVNFLIGNK
jgi:hypothetical protein